VAVGVAAVEAGHKVRYYTAAELVETLYRSRFSITRPTLLSASAVRFSPK